MTVLASFFVESDFYSIEQGNNESHFVIKNSKIVLVIDTEGRIFNTKGTIIGQIDWNSKGHFLAFEPNNHKNLVVFHTYSADRVQSEISIARYIIKFNIAELYNEKIQEKAEK